MPTFFFDIITDKGVIPDRDGCELGNLRAAFEHAKAEALQLAAEHLRGAEANDGRRPPTEVVIRDALGVDLGSVDVIGTASQALEGEQIDLTRAKSVPRAWVVAPTDVEREAATQTIRAHGYLVHEHTTLDAVLTTFSAFAHRTFRIGRPLLFAASHDLASHFGALLSLRTLCPSLFLIIANDGPGMNAINMAFIPRAFSPPDLDRVLKSARK